MHHHPTEPFIKPNSQGLTEKQLPHRPSWVFAVCGKVKPADVFFFDALLKQKSCAHWLLVMLMFLEIKIRKQYFFCRMFSFNDLFDDALMFDI